MVMVTSCVNGRRYVSHYQRGVMVLGIVGMVITQTRQVATLIQLEDGTPLVSCA